MKEEISIIQAIEHNFPHRLSKLTTDNEPRSEEQKKIIISNRLYEKNELAFEEN
jgi:hypothetical protein